ncbi:hypothetical protein CKM354_000087500 [Cercospora kikuchii]|uniref:F-box domain-containing protein n=1 Tax=Cercospora kikuchii TaxID=84275 RepID=A0A9P3C6Q1_9PEZI|nr:uncharacterized protein CKM354_000087500 [Cercospora kikuchii]GIZ37429.1 hypothetical protein CKM354_000087500 [Cercospora kikuchii]
MALNTDGNLAEAGDQQQQLDPNTPMQIEHFPLLELPDELVLRVLYFAVVTSSRDNPVPICKYYDRDLSAWVMPATTPAITKTCQLLRKEGLKMYYKHNVFYLDGTYEGMFRFHDWAMTIKPASRAPIGEIWVRWFKGYRPEDRLSWEWKHELYLHTTSGEFRYGSHGIPREKILVLFRKGKLVMGSGRMADCYQLNVGEAEGSLRDGCVSCAEMLDKWREEPVWRADMRGRIWVRDEEDGEGQDGEPGRRNALPG